MTNQTSNTRVILTQQQACVEIALQQGHQWWRRWDVASSLAALATKDYVLAKTQPGNDWRSSDAPLIIKPEMLAQVPNYFEDWNAAGVLLEEMRGPAETNRKIAALGAELGVLGGDTATTVLSCVLNKLSPRTTALDSILCHHAIEVFGL